MCGRGEEEYDGKALNFGDQILLFTTSSSSTKATQHHGNSHYHPESGVDLG